MSNTNDFLNSRFIIVAPLSSLSIRTRLYKLAVFLNNNHYSRISHVGWERLPGEREETRLHFKINKKILLSKGGYGKGSRKLLYLLWMVKLFFYGFTFKKDDKVWALGFESAFPLLLASKVKGFHLYFDDADRFSMLTKNGILRFIIRKLERLTSRQVYVHIIPSKERYEFTSKKFYLLENMPSNYLVQRAKRIFKERHWIKASLIINVNGWLSESRGVRIMLEVCDALKDENIAFIMAGKLYSNAAMLFSKRPNVQYLGDVSNEEVLASYYASDMVFTYYDPSSEINRYAASNKWGDALKTGIGVIVNKEVVTSKFLLNQGVGVFLEYNNVEDLVHEIRSLVLNKPKVVAYKNKIKTLGEEYIFFDTQLFDLLFNKTSDFQH